MSEPSRVKEIPTEQMSSEQTRVFEDLAAGRGRLPTPYWIWIHAPGVAAGMEKLGTCLNNNSSLTKREVELVICMIANHWKSEYVWSNHVKHSVALGLKPEVFDAIRAAERPPLDDERERTVYELAKVAMEEPGCGSDELFDQAERVLGRHGVAEVLALLGYYSAVSMAMKLHRVPLRG